ncbi:MAG TPA: RsmB/NOP family class I SAM-dependent RNA methyltransferase [Hypericibacter adhaerens]|uniref:RsmB/NOP family class I SAM-dependent RNA methyltransferase n=1 Tax=Hypericibacter adhaerens TaxID=2602016 RepID=UPI002D17BD55|nr:RsmB/NOP family class I SAM-dependent RNA methyltransferase [Hypericibacter adhaerens]HWA43213.1 RsmB/NOP family class I SAM-dependent RNA methyltransferase [Hypericibacter adhaerens]
MTPGARLQAAIELLASIHAGTAPADRAAHEFFRARRYIGGGDRREVLGLTYAVLRARARLDWWIARAWPAEAPRSEETDRLRLVAALLLIEGWNADRVAGSFDGGQYRPAPLSREERALLKALAGQTLDHPEQPDWVRFEYPEWLDAPLRAALGDRFESEMRALMEEAATDIRVNALKADRTAAIRALKAEKVEARPTSLSPWGLRVEGRPPLASLEVFKSGAIEVQDEGSQLVALLTDARPGQRVVDFCAGAGGKTLALAAQMQNKGHIVACDVLEGRILRASTRLRRAGVHNVERRALSTERDPWVKRHAAAFDRVLVDAPCSGSGTWRRNPDQKWRLAPGDLEELLALQESILKSAARLVKQGGRLVYATCALLPAENEGQIRRFLETHDKFHVVPVADVWRTAIGGEGPAESEFLRLSPARQGTDGFFVAVLEREK